MIPPSFSTSNTFALQFLSKPLLNSEKKKKHSNAGNRENLKIMSKVPFQNKEI